MTRNDCAQFLCVGHRGARGHEPENTLRSVEKAFQLGAHWVEIDVYLVEGELVVIHDDTLNRTTNGKGSVAKSTLEYIRSLDAGRGEQVPLLQEICACAEDRGGINIELKGPNTATRCVEIIDELVGAGTWQYQNFIVSSFDFTLLEDVRKLHPRIQIGVLTKRPTQRALTFAIEYKAYSVHPEFSKLTQEYVDLCHAENFLVIPYTVNYIADIKRMQALGVDGVFTDYPERVVNP